MKSTDTFTPRPLAFAIAIAVGAVPAATWAAAAGRVQFALGQVSVQSQGSGAAPLAKGQDVNAGDTIVTELGRVQIRFADGSLVSLQPKTSFKIDDYAYNGAEDGSEKSFFSLFRGGLRTITGAIGHRNRDSYRVSTPVATIGIRGTEYIIKLDDSGAVVTVGDGSIAIINDTGEVVLTNGQTGVIVAKDQAVKLTQNKPVLPPNPPPGKDLRDDPGSNEPLQDSEEFLVGLTQDNGDPGKVLDKLLDSPVLTSGSGFAVASAYYSNWNGDHIVRVDGDTQATFEGGGLKAWSYTQNVEGPSVVSSEIGDLVLVDSGSDQFIGWGRWTNPALNSEGFAKIHGNSNEFFNYANESVHFVVGKPTDLTALAELGETTAEYKLMSFTTPTSRPGFLANAVNVGSPINSGVELGHVNGGSLSLNITQALVSGGVNVSMPSSPEAFDLSFKNISVEHGTFSAGPAYSPPQVTASVNGSGPVQSTNGVVVNHGTCQSCYDGYVSGLIAGPRADRGGFVYHVDGPNPQTTFFGAITFIKK